MPIRTLFARGVRYPRLGIIRLGVTVVKMGDDGQPVLRDGKPVTYPKEVSHFVVPPELAAAPQIGHNPTAIEVSFPADEPERIFDPWLIRYDGPLLAAKCDGVTCTVIPKEGAEVTFPCERPAEGVSKCPKCGASVLGRLNVIPRYAPVFGVYQVLIGGQSRCESLLTELHMYARARLSRNWFTIERQEQRTEIRTTEGKRLARTGWPVHLLFRASPDLMLGASMVQPALTTGSGPIVDDDHDPTGADAPDDADWDISLCYSKAASLGIDATAYGSYLAGVYKGGVDNMTAAQIMDQEKRIKAALADPAKREEFVAAVRNVASKVKPR